MRPIAAAASAVRTYALLVGGAALLIVAAFIQDAGPDRGSEWLGVVVLAGLLAVPPVLLYVFSTALRALADLPQRVRGAPGDLRTHRDEAQRAFGRRGPGSVVLLPFRLLRLSVGARETLTPYAPVLPLVSVPYLVGTGLAAVAGLAELLLGIVALIALAG
jgi:hypothetical protein